MDFIALSNIAQTSGGMIFLFIGILFGIDYTKKNFTGKVNGKPVRHPVATVSYVNDAVASHKSSCIVDVDRRLERGSKRMDRIELKLEAMGDHLTERMDNNRDKILTKIEDIRINNGV